MLSNTFRFHHSRKPFGPSPYWTVRFEAGVLGADEDVNEEALRRLGAGYKPITDKVTQIEAYNYVVHMDQLDATRALVLRERSKGVFDLESLPLP